MRNKGVISAIAILLTLICLYQLSFTLATYNVESEARAQSGGDKQKEQAYLNAKLNEEIWLGQTYLECKEQELNLGLDLRGGMNIVMQVSLPDLVSNLAVNTSNEQFKEVFAKAIQQQENSSDDFITLFINNFQESYPEGKLAAFFASFDKKAINIESSNQEVEEYLRRQAEGSIESTVRVLRSRIDRYGVTQPNIQRLQTAGRIQIELPGIKEPERVKKLLQGTAQLEFWTLFSGVEVAPLLNSINEQSLLHENGNKASGDSTSTNADALASNEASTSNQETTELSEIEELESAETEVSSETSEFLGSTSGFFGLINQVQPASQNPTSIIGRVLAEDTGKVNLILNLPEVKELLAQRRATYAWLYKADEEGYFTLFLLKSINGKPALSGDIITDAKVDFGEAATREVSMTMNNKAAEDWARITRENVGKSVAIVLDGVVYSFPTVQSEIKGGQSRITGNFTMDEATDLANLLISGKLPVRTLIEQEDMVGPSLGEESIRAGLYSFIIAFILVLVYMIFFYSGKAGVVANIALIVNLFFIIGILAAWGAVLTLPGIAGMVLTIGMAVDANVLIFERIQEEVRLGKNLQNAIREGFKHALSAILDGNITTFITGVILYVFGTGPIRGFATTLIIGILTSLFSALFISRLIFEASISRGKKITFVSSFTQNILTSTKVNFLGKRKITYVISSVVIILGIGSLALRGLDYGIDFEGGRSYQVVLDKEVDVEELSTALSTELDNESPQVKTMQSITGDDRKRFNITTKYLIDEASAEADEEVLQKLYAGCKSYIKDGVTYEQFINDYRLQTRKVGPTISDDITRDAFIAIIIALIAIFLYILVRFRNWQYSLGAVSALAHDSLFVLGAFSLLYSIMPFPLQIDQAFIAAILTVVGYSINDTVIIFDRIREERSLHLSTPITDIINKANNATIRRTVSTSLSTLVVLTSIFLFGGATIKSFSFALLIGVLVGTYSSFFVATPIVYDTIKKLEVKRVIPVSKKKKRR